MTINDSNRPTSRKPLRVWPGVALAAIVLVLRYIVAPVATDAELFQMPVAIIAILGGLAGALAIFIWWLLFSRAAWSERLGAIALIVVAFLVTSRLVDKSIAGGMMGNLLMLYAVPLLSLALVAWAVTTRRLADGTRRALLVAFIVLACVPFTLLRTAGSFGAGSEFHWRWTPTPEDRLLAQANKEPGPVPPAPAPPAAPAPEVAEEPAAPTPKAEEKPVSPPPAKKETATAEAPAPAVVKRPAEWPGFRGPDRDSVIHGVQIQTDWSASPPAEIWRRPIGPGWSSFAVDGDMLYTQEQRGDDEMVTAYRVSTGEPVWRHSDPVRFWESNGGAGPRGTPTLSDGRVYAFGATGILNALDARNGKVIWSRNVAADTEVELPGWGFASSPVVIDGIVIVAASGRLAAYDAATGERRWLGPTGGSGYSSPHVVTIAGVTQVLLLRGSRTISVAPADGTLLWDHTWVPGSSIVQPALADGDVLIAGGDAMGGQGIRRIAVKQAADGWTTEERWTSRGLKPYFNDFVVHEGHAYGFDGSILACIDLANGERKWKGGRYGQGQLVLLPEQDLLLVISEEGELALVSATTAQYKEIARFKALDAKTWNHPVVVRDVLLVRNGEEMAAFRLPRAPAASTTER